MPYIQLKDRQFPLRVGETTVGTSGADIAVEGPAALGVQAKLQVANDQSVVIRRASSEAVVRVNGVQLGVEPHPLIHGDKVDVAGAELMYGDDRKGGQTQYITGSSVAGMAEAYMPSARPAATTGGRLVSLVDGREYSVGAAGLTLGRDAGCDVVVASPEVSRRHAELAAGPEGYVLTDLSTNGVFVNGQRINKSQMLGRGDVLRVGTEEFRFYADAAAPSAAPSAAPPAAPAPTPPVAAAPAPAASGAPPAMATPAAVPAQPSAAAAAPAGASPGTDPRPVLATLEVMNEGPNKGKRFEIRTPLVHVGRGAHNDIALTDDSVSDSHAKIQKREGGWFVVDMGSTNGTWCGGERIAGESALKGHASLRFGAMRLTFAAADEGRDGQGGTRVMRGLSADQAMRPAAAPARVAEPPEGPAKSGVPMWVWFVVVLLLAAAVFFFLGSRR